MAKSISMKIISVLLILVSVFSCSCFSASAATDSWGTNTRVITVTTKANWLKPGSESITLKQNKGTRTNDKGKQKKCYGYWNISFSSTDGKHKGNAKLTGGSVKINLKPNKTYHITVSWNHNIDTVDSMKNGSFSYLPTWSVKSTNKVTSYY